MRPIPHFPVEMFTYQPGEPIDIVYTWVRNDPELTAARQRWQSAVHVPLKFMEEASGEARFRDLDELRHSLRSVDKFAPWVRKIFIVTNGQIPDGIDFTNPRLKLITHTEIFPNADDLPTFNSITIESCLHRIPGLARWFLYFNNDVFLGAPILIEDLFNDMGQQKLFFSTLQKQKWHNKTLFAIFSLKTIFTVNQFYGCQNPPYTLLHAPQLMNRDSIAAIESRFEELFEKLRQSRFRSADEIHVHTFYYHILLATGDLPVETWSYHSRYTEYISLRDESFIFGLVRLVRTTLNLVRNRPKFICFNDELLPISSWRTGFQLAILRTFYRIYFPKPCSFEKS